MPRKPQPLEQIPPPLAVLGLPDRCPINIVSPTLIPGGPEQQATLLCEGLKELGYKVRLYSADQGVPDLSHGRVTIWWGRIDWPRKPPGSVWVCRNPAHTAPPPEMVDRFLNVQDIWNGIDPADWPALPPSGPALSKDEPLTVGYLGRYAEEKSPALMLDMMEHISGHRLEMFGAGPLEEDLRHRADEMDGVRVHGWTNTHTALRAIDALIIPSKHEGCPSAAIEAAFAGVPVIHCGQGCLSEMLPNGVRGIEARATAKEIAAGIRRLASDRWLWEDIRRNARAYAEDRLTVDVMARKYAAVIEKLQRPARAPRDRARILCLADQPGWAFENGHKDGEQYLSDEFKHTHYLVRDYIAGVPLPDLAQFDLISCPYVGWECMQELPMERTLGAQRSQYWTGRGSRAPGAVQWFLANKFAAFHVVTEGSFADLKDHVPRLYKMPNPVNARRFSEQTKVKDVVACWAGNAGRKVGKDDLKGFYSRVLPAVRQARVPLVYAEFHTRRLTPQGMEGLYLKASVLVHASSQEGCCKVLLESMASGLAVITTRTGTVPEMVRQQERYYGDTGIIAVEREVSAIVEALEELKRQPSRLARMGQLNRMLVEEFWSWDVWADRYRDFFRMGL